MTRHTLPERRPADALAAKALTRNVDGTPSAIAGAIADRLLAHLNEAVAPTNEDAPDLTAGSTL